MRTKSYFSDEALRFAGLEGQPPGVIALALRRFTAIREEEQEGGQKAQRVKTP